MGVSRFRHSKAGKAAIIGLSAALLLNLAGSVLPILNKRVEAAQPLRLEQNVFDDEVLRVKREENTVYFDIKNADFDELSVHHNVYEVDDFSGPGSIFGNTWSQYTYKAENPPMERVQEDGEYLLRFYPAPGIFTGLINNAFGFDASDYSQLVVNMEYDANNPVVSMFGSEFMLSAPFRFGIDAHNVSGEMDDFDSFTNVSSRKDYVFPFSGFVSEDTGSVLQGDFIQYLKLLVNNVPQEAPFNIYSVQFRDEGQVVRAENGQLSWSEELKPGQTDIRLELYANNEADSVTIKVDSIPLVVYHAPKINDFYFISHPATLMQGVTAKDKIFSMPLDGAPELGAVMGTVADGYTLEWSVESNGAAVNAYIQNNNLYIAAEDPHWTGDTDVTVTLTDGTGQEDKVNIPVVVFKTDKTRINAEGKKEYFVPWSPQLDINRILS